MAARNKRTPNGSKSSKSTKAKKPPVQKGLVTAADVKRANDNAKKAQEDIILAGVNWQWRKFALGLMNGLANYKAYAEAYNMPTVDRDERAYMVAAACSSKLLKNAKFLEYWREIIKEQGFNHDVVDVQALKLITDEDTPPAVRRAAIRDYNELQGRIIKKATMTDGSGKSLFDDDSSSFELKVVRASK
ncbi:MAG: hypothetical protein WC426_13660 [Sulfuriferula sp.]